MGWTGHKINRKGDLLYIRGGVQGFSGSYLKAGNKNIDIEFPEVLEMVIREKLRLQILDKLEEALDELDAE